MLQQGPIANPWRDLSSSFQAYNFSWRKLRWERGMISIFTLSSQHYDNMKAGTAMGGHEKWQWPVLRSTVEGNEQHDVQQTEQKDSTWKKMRKKPWDYLLSIVVCQVWTTFLTYVTPFNSLKFSSIGLSSPLYRDGNWRHGEGKPITQGRRVVRRKRGRGKGHLLPALAGSGPGRPARVRWFR